MDRGAIEATANLIGRYSNKNTEARLNLIASQIGNKALSATEKLTAQAEEELNFRLIDQLVGLLPQSSIDAEGTESIEVPDASYARRVQASIVMSSDRFVTGLCYIIGEKPTQHKRANQAQRMFTNLLLWPANSNSPLRPHVVEVPETDYSRFESQGRQRIAEPPSPAESGQWLDTVTGKLHISTDFSVGTYPEQNKWIRKSFQVTRLAELGKPPRPQLNHVQTFDNILADSDISQYNLLFHLTKLVNDFGIETQAAELLREEAAKLK